MPLFGRRREPEMPKAEEEQRPALPDPPPVDDNGLRSLVDHRDYLLSCVAELPPFGMHLLDAVDLAINEDVHAEVDLPGFDNSAMDGYAVVARDVATASDERPVHLPVIGEIGAGQARLTALAEGTAAKIMTGAPVPAGAEAVVPYEWTDRGEATVRIAQAPEPGQHVRLRGDDILPAQ